MFEMVIDIANKQSILCTPMNRKYILAVPVTRDDTTSDSLQQARHLPGSSATLGVTEKTLLRYDGHGVTRGS